MESSSDKHWAHKALIDPLMEPEPAQEDGPGTSFRGQPATASSPPPPPVRTPISPASSTGSVLRKKNNPYRKSSSASKNPFVSANEISPKNAYPSPPQSSSPHRDQFPHRKEAFAEYRDVPSPPPNGDSDSTPSRRRGSSLTERFPGDRSHKPLEAMKKDAKAANRAPHLRKHHQIRPDSIDQLDLTGAGYHHEGPFDATYLARNTSYTNSPLEALAQSNEEAIKATPRERIIDSIERHRPLDGVATYPPGEEDPSGHVYNYEPGENLMIEGNPEGGAYKRWPGIQYLPEDIKGKGEPSYSIEKALKSDHGREGSDGIEMKSRPRSAHYSPRGVWDDEQPPTTGSGIGRSNTTGQRPRNSSGSGGIRRRFGSIRRSLGKKDD